MDGEISWGWGNGVLYRMCRNNPRHRDRDVIVGKMWLIGRAYAASIERGAGMGDHVYAAVAAKIADSALDWVVGERG